MRQNLEFRQCNCCGVKGVGRQAPALIRVEVHSRDATAIVSSSHLAGAGMLAQQLNQLELTAKSNACVVIELCATCVVSKPILSSCRWSP